MHDVLVNRLGGLSLPRKGVVRLPDRPDITTIVYGGRETTTQQQQLYRAVFQREGERREKRQMREKNVQTTRTYCKRSWSLPYYNAS